MVRSFHLELSVGFTQAIAIERCPSLLSCLSTIPMAIVILPRDVRVESTPKKNLMSSVPLRRKSAKELMTASRVHHQHDDDVRSGWIRSVCRNPLVFNCLAIVLELCSSIPGSAGRFVQFYFARLLTVYTILFLRVGCRLPDTVLFRSVRDIGRERIQVKHSSHYVAQFTCRHGDRYLVARIFCW